MVPAPVTADEATKAAEEAAPLIAPGALCVDMPIMAPVLPGPHRTPLLISGPGAEQALPMLDSLGMQARLIDGKVGSAPSIRMIRTVMIEGRRFSPSACCGPPRPGRRRGAGLAGRVEPGSRLAGARRRHSGADDGARAPPRAKMREVAKTVAALGLPPGLSAATAERQGRLGGLGLAPGDADPGPVRRDVRRGRGGTARGRDETGTIFLMRELLQDGRHLACVSRLQALGCQPAPAQSLMLDAVRVVEGGKPRP